MAQRLRIFISSPGDVPDERLRADLVIDKLAQDYSRFFAIDGYRWEHEPMLASGHFQDAVEPPSKFDIVVMILWSRLGTPLPGHTATREYRGIDGRAPVTGTEWEYEDALQAARAHGAPDILAFRNVSPAPIDPRDVEARARSIAQLDALDAFWKRHFADRGIFLAAYDEYRTLEEFAHRLEESLRKLIERRIAGETGLASTPVWSSAPFRGLSAYEFEHAAIFFGRDGAVAKAAEQLATQARAGSAFLLISGPSGSGKSSLAKAALVPRLMKPQRISGAAFLRRVVLRPSEGSGDVIAGLAEALTRGAGTDGVGVPELLAPRQNAAQLATYLRASIGEPGFVFAAALARLTQAGRTDGSVLAYEEAKLLLVVDQLEELFTVPGIGTEDRALFIKLLTGLARSGAVWVIATLRSDFWHRAAEIPELVALAQGFGRLDIAAPSPAELAEMIRKPAQLAGLSFEINDKTGLGLDAVLAEDAATEPGALPLLSFTLDELYRRDIVARQGKVLTFATYEELGELDGAIATRADEVVGALPEPAQKALPRVLRMLAAVSTGAEHVAVARSASIASFAPGSDARTLVDALTAARLLVASTEGSEPTVRLAHEALISRWTRAREQLMSDRRDLETRELVERQQRRWQDVGGPAQRQLLLRDPDLANAVDLARRWGDELAPDTRKFIQASAQRARLRQQLTAAAALIFAVVAVGATTAGVLAYRAQQEAVAQRNRAEAATDQAKTERDRAEAATVQAKAERDRASTEEQRATEARDRAVATQSRLLAERASRLTEQGDTPTAVLLSLEAFRNPDDNGPERYEVAAEKSLADALYRNPLQSIASNDQVNYGQAAFSYDGSRLFTLDADGAAAIWAVDAQGRPGKKQPRPDFGEVKTIFANPTKPIVFIRLKDLSYFAWNYQTEQKVKGTEGKCDDELGNYSDFKFDRSGERLLIWCKQINIVELATGRVVNKPGSFTSVSLSGDGKRFATLREKVLTVEVWTTATGALVKSWNAPETGLVLMNFNGEITYTRYGYYRIRAWKSATGTVLFQELPNQVRSLDVFADPITDLLATAGDDGVKVWNGKTGEVIQHLPDAGIQDFLPNGLLAVKEGEKITLWEYIIESRLGHFEAKRRAVLDANESQSLAAISADGKRLASITEGGDIFMWRTDPAMLLRANDNAGECLRSVTTSGDGKVIAAATALKPSGTYVPALCSAVSPADAVTVWDTDTLAEKKRLDYTRYQAVNRIRLDRSGGRMLIGASAKPPPGAKKPNQEEPAGPTGYEVVETATGRRLFPAQGQLMDVDAPELSADGEWVAAINGQKLDLWRVTDGVKSTSCTLDEAIEILAFDQGSNRLAVAGKSGTVWLIDPAKNCAASNILSLGGKVEDLDLRFRDGLVIVRMAWSDNSDQKIASRLLVWSEQEQKVLVERLSDAPSQNWGGTAPFDVLPTKERLLLAEATDNTIRLVDAASDQEVGTFVIDTNGCCDPIHIRFYSDRNRLLSAWGERDTSRLRQWRVLPTIEEMRDYAKRMASECLSPNRRRQFGLEPEPPRWCIEMAKQPYDTAEWKRWLADKIAGRNPPIPE
jgi:WD40 repeat protein